MRRDSPIEGITTTTRGLSLIEWCMKGTGRIDSFGNSCAVMDIRWLVGLIIINSIILLCLSILITEVLKRVLFRGFVGVAIVRVVLKQNFWRLIVLWY